MQCHLKASRDCWHGRVALHQQRPHWCSVAKRGTWLTFAAMNGTCCQKRHKPEASNGASGQSSLVSVCIQHAISFMRTHANIPLAAAKQRWKILCFMRCHLKASRECEPWMHARTDCRAECPLCPFSGRRPRLRPFLLAAERWRGWIPAIA